MIRAQEHLSPQCTRLHRPPPLLQRPRVVRAEVLPRPLRVGCVGGGGRLLESPQPPVQLGDPLRMRGSPSSCDSGVVLGADARVLRRVLPRGQVEPFPQERLPTTDEFLANRIIATMKLKLICLLLISCTTTLVKPKMFVCKWKRILTRKTRRQF